MNASEQARADARCDAEQLRIAIGGALHVHPLTSDTYIAVPLRAKGFYTPKAVGDRATEAARCAFRTVPGLRGEDTSESLNGHLCTDCHDSFGEEVPAAARCSCGTFYCKKCLDALYDGERGLCCINGSELSYPGQAR